MNTFTVSLLAAPAQQRYPPATTVVVTPGTLPATDNFESYTPGADLNALNGGTNWASDAAYVSRQWCYFSALCYDTFEQYTPAADLNSQNGGTNVTSSWAGAFVSR